MAIVLYVCKGGYWAYSWLVHDAQSVFALMGIETLNSIIQYCRQFNGLFPSEKTNVVLPVADEKPWHRFFALSLCLGQLWNIMIVWQFGSLIDLLHLKWDCVTFKRTNNTIFLLQMKGLINKRSNAVFLNSVHSEGFAAAALLTIVRDEQ